MVDILFGPEVRLMLQEDDDEGMKTFLRDAAPRHGRRGARRRASPSRRSGASCSTPASRNQAAIFAYFPIDWQVQMVEGTGRQHMAQLIEQMSHDDRADLLRRLRPRGRREPAAPGRRGRPPRHRHAGQVPGEHRRRPDDDRLRLAAGQHHRRARRSTGCACRRPTARRSTTSTSSTSSAGCSAWCRCAT